MRIFSSLAFAFSCFCMPLTAMPVDIRERGQEVQQEFELRPVVEWSGLSTEEFGTWLDEPKEDIALAFPEGLVITLKTESESALFALSTDIKIQSKVRIVIAKSGGEWFVKGPTRWVNLLEGLQKGLWSNFSPDAKFKITFKMEQENSGFCFEFDSLEGSAQD